MVAGCPELHQGYVHLQMVWSKVNERQGRMRIDDRLADLVAWNLFTGAVLWRVLLWSQTC